MLADAQMGNHLVTYNLIYAASLVSINTGCTHHNHACLSIILNTTSNVPSALIPYGLVWKWLVPVHAARSALRLSGSVRATARVTAGLVRERARSTTAVTAGNWFVRALYITAPRCIDITQLPTHGRTNIPS